MILRKTCLTRTTPNPISIKSITLIVKLIPHKQLNIWSSSIQNRCTPKRWCTRIRLLNMTKIWLRIPLEVKEVYLDVRIYHCKVMLDGLDGSARISFKDKLRLIDKSRFMDAKLRVMQWGSLKEIKLSILWSWRRFNVDFRKERSLEENLWPFANKNNFHSFSTSSLNKKCNLFTEH